MPPRPILKSPSSCASTNGSSSSGGGGDSSTTNRSMDKIKSEVHAPGAAFSSTTRSHRRVTFSPFTRPMRGKEGKQPRRVVTAAGSRHSSLSSGFTFSSAATAEKRKESRRKQELQTMEALYSAAKRRPNSLKALLLANVPALKQLQTWATDCMDYAKAMRDAVPWPRRARRKPRPRTLLRGPWTDFDDADHAYVNQLALVSSPLVAASQTRSVHAGRSNSLALLPNRTPQPDLTPARQGSFTSLLRREGIPVEEDEEREMQAVDEDLRGISHPSRRPHVLMSST